MARFLPVLLASLVATAACGARSGLPFGAAKGEGGAGGTGGQGTGGAPMDASPDVPLVPDAAFDSPEDAPFDSPVDSPVDAVFDAPADAPLDVQIVEDCQDAGITYIYLIADDNELLRFDPASLTTTSIGVIDCPIAMPSPSPTPYSMAVDRKGIGYVVYTDGELFRVSTATASCEATSFVIGQGNDGGDGGFSTEFGMGFSADTNDPGEKLFIAGNQSMQLATLDTTSFVVSPIGVFSSPVGEAELTGTGGGDLYAFGFVTTDDMIPGINLAHIDKRTATVLSDTVLTVASGTTPIEDWAFAYWGGDFYFFTSTDGSTTSVSQYTPGGPLNIPTVATIGHGVVGAGVSTCAPQQ